MRLIILTQYYPPEIGAPQARLSEMASQFVRCGHSVTVLTAMPNYPAGKVYPGYRGLLRRERLDGVDVIRTFIYPSKGTGLLRRLSNYFSFVCSSMIAGTVCLRRSDYLLVESPPLFLGLAGLWLSWFKRARLIFNVSDLWPESAVRLNVIRRSGLFHRLSTLLEGLCYRKAFLITGQSKGILTDILRRFPDRIVFHLSNGVDTQKFRPETGTEQARKALASDRGCVVLYAGLHGLAQGLDQLLLAADKLQENKDLSFTLIGDGPEKANLLAQAKKAQLANVQFLNPRPAGEIPALVAAADIALVMLKTHIPGAVPSKLYEAMASGRPVILAAEGEAAQLVRDHRTGITVAPGDISGLINAIETLRADPALRRSLGINGRITAEALFDRMKIVTRFIDFLEEALEHRG